MAENHRVHLSKTKVAYTRPGETYSLLIRELNLEKKKYTAFGAKGQDQLTNMYYGILALVKTHRKDIVKKSKYKHAELEYFLESLTEGDMRKVDDVKITKSQTEFRTDQVQLRMIVDEYSRMGLFLFDSIGGSTPLTGLYLFVSTEILELLKYMNKQYGIGETQFKSFRKFDNDDFIDL